MTVPERCKGCDWYEDGRCWCPDVELVRPWTVSVAEACRYHEHDTTEPPGPDEAYPWQTAQEDSASVWQNN